MEEHLARIWQHLVGRLHGPLTLRLLLQPTMAAIFAIRSGLRDARQDRPPYFWAILSSPEHRRELLRQGWKDVGKVYLAAIALDLVYSFIAFRRGYPFETLIVAALLALLPYLLVRGPVTRLARPGGSAPGKATGSS